VPPVVTLSELIEAGAHFGHRASRWNPKMKPFIFGKRNLIHILDLRATVRGLIRATSFLEKLSGQGGEVIFVGTKRQAKELIASEAKRCGMHYVNERWLGGTLTNFPTIMSRLKRLEELEGLDKTGGIEEYSKKMVSSLKREKKKIVRNLDGVRAMKRKPDAIVIVDPSHEHICVKEAKKLGIPTICLLDSNCDPDSADIAIPGNDDAFRSIQAILGKLAESILRGRTRYKTHLEEQKKLEEQKRAEDAKKAEAIKKARDEEMAKKKAETAAAPKPETVEAGAGKKENA